MDVKKAFQPMASVIVYRCAELMKKLTMRRWFAIVVLCISVFCFSVSTVVWGILIKGESIFICNVDVWFILTTSRDQLPNYYPRFAGSIWVLSKFFVLLGFPSSIVGGLTALSSLNVLKVTTDRVLLSLISTLFAAFLVEVVLRVVGFIPGQFQYNQWVINVEELHPLHGFRADENGIFKVDTAVILKIRKDLDNQVFEPENMGLYCSENDITPEVAAVIDDYLFLDEINCEFSHKVELLQNSGQMDALDSLIFTFSKRPINEEGFFSIPFTRVQDRPKILMLGDSFTWGHSTTNKAGSFANTLLARGHAVYNTGLSGADLPQYNAVLQHYRTIIDPDIVVLNLFIGNDIVPYERQVAGHQPIHYTTNAGNILAYQAGKQYTTMQDAYDNVMNNMVVPKTSFLNRIASKTVLTGYAWAVGVRLMLIDHQFTEFPPNPMVPQSRKELQKLVSYCQNHDIPLVISVIPELRNGQLLGANKYPSVFSGFNYTEPQMALEHYDLTDGHFNNAGHLHYADHLEKRIISELNE